MGKGSGPTVVRALVSQTPELSGCYANTQIVDGTAGHIDLQSSRTKPSYIRVSALKFSSEFLNCATFSRLVFDFKLSSCSYLRL